MSEYLGAVSRGTQGDFPDKDMGNFGKRIKWPISYSIARACGFLSIFHKIMCLVTDFSKESVVHCI